MDPVGCAPLLGAWVRIQSSVSAWGLQKPGKKSKLPAGKATWRAGGAHRGTVLDLLDTALPKFLAQRPRSYEVYAVCSGAGRGLVTKHRNASVTGCPHGITKTTGPTQPSGALCAWGTPPPPATLHPWGETGYSSRMRIRVFRVSNWSSSAVTSGWLSPARMSRSR